jgi:cobyrinic acid a,c-diamide synthase
LSASAAFCIPLSSKEAIIKGLVIGATKSGSGKTTITLALLAALQRRNMRTAPFKVGPDFIDCGHHTAVSGSDSYNLDGWMLSADYNRTSFARHVQSADIAVVEGVMGLFDGYDGKSEAGSTAQMAKWLHLPVLLIVDAKSMARSAAALVQGFERFDCDLTFAGVVFNNVGSVRHLTYLKDALAEHVAMPCLGGLPRNETISLPERHLGLITRQDYALSQKKLDTLSRMLETNLDLDRMLARLPDITLSSYPAPDPGHKLRVKIGVARDRAFCFYYPDNLETLTRCGARLVPFSPIRDAHLPEDLDGLYLGGGYPELSAEKLAHNATLRAQIKEMSRRGMPIFSECGGFMYLCREIYDLSGKRFPMVGCFPFSTRMQARLKSLGYRQITLAKPSILGPAGLELRGHEFHYSALEGDEVGQDIETVFSVTARTGMASTSTGYFVNRTLGSYIHLHFGSRPDAACAFVDNCLTYQYERIKG